MSQFWDRLDPINRAQLIPVIEGPGKGGRKGCIIVGDWEYSPLILRMAGLDYMLNTEPLAPYPVFVVGRAEDLEAYKRNLDLSLLRGEHKYHQITGDFLGYPGCCIREYVSPMTLGSDGWKSRFHKELSGVLEKGKEYPEELDYAPATFTPCSVYCPSALETLGRWGEMIERCDPEAAGEFRRFRARSYMEGYGRTDVRVSDLPSLYRR